VRSSNNIRIRTIKGIIYFNPGFVGMSLTALFIILVMLVILSDLLSTAMFIAPDYFWYEFERMDGRIVESDIQIRIDNWSNWSQLPYSLKMMIILRKNLNGMLYLCIGLVKIYLLREFYKEALDKEKFGSLNVKHIRIIGVLLIIYSMADFLTNLLLNTGIVLNDFTAASDKIQVGTRIIPPVEFEIFIFGFIILVISDIYIRINEIQEDVNLTI
jgi:hypothetical protein